MAKESTTTTKKNKLRVTKDKNPISTGASLYNGDQRLGFAHKINGNPATYGVAVDNMGSPYRGAYDGSINTPIGQVGYGYDGDTGYANYTPNQYVQALANLLSKR